MATAPWVAGDSQEDRLPGPSPPRVRGAPEPGSYNVVVKAIGIHANTGARPTGRDPVGLVVWLTYRPSRSSTLPDGSGSVTPPPPSCSAQPGC